MYPESMLKVEVAILSSNLESFVKELHKEGIVHLEVVKDLEWIKNSPPHSSIEILSEKVKYIRDCLFIADKIGLTFGIKSNKKYSKKILEDFINRYKEIVDLEKELEWVNKGNLKTAKILNNFGINNERFEQKRFLYELYQVNSKRLDNVKKMVSENDIDLDVISISKNNYVLLSGGPKDKEIFTLIAKENAMIPISLVGIKSVKNTEVEIKKLKNEISKKHFDLRIELSDYINLLKKDLAEFEVDLERAKIVSKFGKSNLTHYLKGWICKKDKLKLDNIIKKYDDSGIVFYSDPEFEEVAPTKFKNNKLVQPFESLVTFLSVPKSNELDPSLIFALFLPMFFGFVMGDFGYSLIVLLVAYFARSKFKKNSFGQNLLTILCYSATWGIFFGIIFGEGFGFDFEFEILGIAFPIIKRITDVIVLFGISLIFGFIHMLLGYTLGAIQTFKMKRMKDFYVNVIWIAMQISWLLMAIGFVDIGLYLMGILTLLILYFNGLMGILDITSLFGNIVSYVRLGAVGLSGVIFSMMINMIKPDLSQGFLIILTTVLFIVFTIFTIILSVYSGLIQSGRLHAVECLSKFFEGGGYFFEPFAMKENEDENENNKVK